MKNNWSLRSILTWLSIALFGYGFFVMNKPKKPDLIEIRFSDFVQDVQTKRIKDVMLASSTSTAIATYENQQRVRVNYPEQDHYFVKRLLDNNVMIRVILPDESLPFWFALFTAWLPTILLFGLIFYSNMSARGGGGAFGFGRSKAKRANDKEKKVSFKDVAGLPEAKDDLLEIVDFLKNPERFIKVGAKIPKGVLLYGPPGTGKTLLAKAIAGEAKVPFLYISGSEFVEMFVGVGASRVRDLFSQAKKIGRCIIFIDELDSMGKRRNMMSINDERETTLNQFLVELDGFDTNTGVIVIGATNRPDVLDPALLRPGRFDRLISVPLPDARGREEILKVHLSKVKVDQENGINLKHIVQVTIGMSGAQLANIVNESAIVAGRNRRPFITTADLTKAMEEAILGSKTSIVMQEKERELTAYHEAGHAIVGLFTQNSNPIFKVTIVPTGKALGMVVSLPELDQVSVSKAQLLDRICMAMGGRVAEELRFGPEYVTSGASSDIENATNVATNMVTKWGMSEAVGYIRYTTDDDHMTGTVSRASEEMLKTIDTQIREIIGIQYNRAKEIITKNFENYNLLAENLLKYETLTGAQIKYLFEHSTLDDYSHVTPEDEARYIYRGTESKDIESESMTDEPVRDEPTDDEPEATDDEPKGHESMGTESNKPIEVKPIGVKSKDVKSKGPDPKNPDPKNKNNEDDELGD